GNSPCHRPAPAGPSRRQAMPDEGSGVNSAVGDAGERVLHGVNHLAKNHRHRRASGGSAETLGVSQMGQRLVRRYVPVLAIIATQLLLVVVTGGGAPGTVAGSDDTVSADANESAAGPGAAAAGGASTQAAPIE